MKMKDLVPGFKVPESKLTVVKLDRIDKHRNKYFLCECECGNLTTVTGGHITSGHTTSCGCINKGGLSHTPEYESLHQAIKRCHNPNDKDYHRYGARGITVSERYKGSDRAQNLIKDIGRKPTAKHSLDRIDNDKGYEQGNVRWADPVEQANNRRGNRLITYKDETLTLAQWSKRLDVQRDLIKDRLSRGWSVERALTTPVKKQKNNAKRS